METIVEEGVADAVLGCQVLPTVIQMAAPQRALGDTDSVPAQHTL